MCLALFVFVTCCREANAGYWSWKRYRIKFWLPDGMSATKNNKKVFIAKGRGLVLKIIPWTSSKTTSEQAAKRGVKSYRIVKAKRVIYTKRIRVYGAWNYVIVGAGRVNREPAFFAVMGLVSKTTPYNFYVRFWWYRTSHRWVKPKINLIAKRLRLY